MYYCNSIVHCTVDALQSVHFNNCYSLWTNHNTSDSFPLIYLEILSVSDFAAVADLHLTSMLYVL